MTKLKKTVLIMLGLLIVLAAILFGYVKYYLESEIKIQPAHSKLIQTEFIDNNITDSISKYLQKNMRNKGMISIAFIDNNETYFYGVLRKDDSLIHIDNKDSLFQIGSISKVFTSTLLSEMIESEELNLGDNIDQHLGYQLKDNLKISLKSLSNHASGLDRMPSGVYIQMAKNFEDPYQNYTNDWLKNYLQMDIEVDKTKIGKSNYSNLGLAILGYTLSQKTGKSYSQLCNNFIFSKYKMNSSFVYNGVQVITAAYDMEGNKATIWNLKSFNPAGGIVSNVMDMSKFAIAQLDTNNLVLQRTHNETVRLNENMAVGLGWHLLKDKNDHKWIWHNGATGTHGGYSSSMTIDMDSRKGIVILSNVAITDLESNLDKLSYSLLNYLNKKSK